MEVWTSLSHFEQQIKPSQCKIHIALTAPSNNGHAAILAQVTCLHRFHALVLVVLLVLADIALERVACWWRLLEKEEIRINIFGMFLENFLGIFSNISKGLKKTFLEKIFWMIFRKLINWRTQKIMMMKVLKVKGERLTGTRKLRENQKNKSRNQTKTMYRT